MFPPAQLHTTSAGGRFGLLSLIGAPRLSNKGIRQACEHLLATIARKEFDMVKHLIKTILVRVRNWLNEESPTHPEPMKWTNSYEWISEAFRWICEDPLAASGRGPYVWGVLQGASLAKVLGYQRISVLEFGVAGGAGLLKLERIAELVEKLLDIRIEVYGFDTGKGLPKPTDYRDLPYMWIEGEFWMDEPALQGRLRRAQLKLGDVETTVPEFLRTSFAPVAFVSIDLDLYSATKYALALFNTEQSRLLPRVFCYFDDIMGYGCNDYTGERLAIHEFNAEQKMRKLSPIYGLKWFVPAKQFNEMWIECMYIAHIFDHSFYGNLSRPHGVRFIDVNGKWTEQPVAESCSV
jgi:hypothetical protein